jgi:hypothetical protein
MVIMASGRDVRFDDAGSQLYSRVNFDVSGVQPSGSASGEFI